MAVLFSNPYPFKRERVPQKWMQVLHCQRQFLVLPVNWYIIGTWMPLFQSAYHSLLHHGLYPVMVWHGTNNNLSSKLNVCLCVCVFSLLDSPISVIFLAPAVTPWKTTLPGVQNGANNPGIRVFKYDRETLLVKVEREFHLYLSPWIRALDPEVIRVPTEGKLFCPLEISSWSLLRWSTVTHLSPIHIDSLGKGQGRRCRLESRAIVMRILLIVRRIRAWFKKSWNAILVYLADGVFCHGEPSHVLVAAAQENQMKKGGEWLESPFQLP